MATMDDYEVDPITGLKKQKAATGTLSPTATAAGAEYQKSVMSRLSGRDSVVENARQDTQAQTAVQQYLAGQRARDASAQAGYTPGTLQYQRTQDREMRTANDFARDAGRNLGDLTRARSTEALSMAKDLETTEQKAISDLINSVADNPVASNYLRRIQAAGGDVRKAYETLFSGTGISGGDTGSGGGGGTDTTTGGSSGTDTITPGPMADAFRPQTEAEKELEAIKDELRVGNFQGDLDAEAQRLYNQRKSDATRAADDARRAANLAAAREIVATRGFDALNEEQRAAFLEGTSMRDASALPSTRTAIEEIVSGKIENQFYKINGTPYQVLDYYQQTRWNRGGGYDNRHSDWTKVKDLTTGATKYIRSDGIVLDYRPPNAPSGKKLSYDTARGVWVASGNAANQYYNPISERWEKRPPQTLTLAPGAGGSQRTV